MGKIIFDTGGNASNSGSRDDTSPHLTGSAATVSGSTVTLDGSPDLSGVVTSGANQDSIYINDATNSNQKIFWITAVDNGAKTVTVSVAPTGVTSSAWRIGGSMVYTPANWEAAVRAGDEVIFNNSPASRSGAAFLTMRTAGTAAAGFVKCYGKTGARPKLTITDNNNVIAGSVAAWWFYNLEFEQQGASGNVVSPTGLLKVFENCKISDGGGIGFSLNVAATNVISSEISGVGGDGISGTATASSPQVIGNYIHDTTGDGVEFSGAQAAMSIVFNIFDTCAGNGVRISSSTTFGQGCYALVQQNTFYGCGNSGLEITDGDFGTAILIGNIFSENGNAAGESNVEMATNAFENGNWHSYNVFHHSGGGSATNLTNVTANATESTSDPLFGNPGSGDFSIGSSSPAKATSYPGAFLGGPTGYLDIGAVQRQETGGGAIAFPGLHAIEQGIAA